MSPTLWDSRLDWFPTEDSKKGDEKILKNDKSDTSWYGGSSDIDLWGSRVFSMFLICFCNLGTKNRKWGEKMSDRYRLMAESGGLSVILYTILWYLSFWRPWFPRKCLWNWVSNASSKGITSGHSWSNGKISCQDQAEICWSYRGFATRLNLHYSTRVPWALLFSSGLISGQVSKLVTSWQWTIFIDDLQHL